MNDCGERMTAPSSVSAALDQLKKSYDAEVKNLLKEKQILAVILKNCVNEFQDCRQEDIAEKYIEGVPQTNAAVIDQDAAFPDIVQRSRGSRITGDANEDKSIREGQVTYDIRFVALAPGTGEPIKLIINIEAQRETKGQQYSVVTRGIYYCGRLISAQKNVEFTGMHYEDIKKVYSIWICQNVPEDKELSIISYEIRENILKELHVVKPEPRQNYDLMTILILGLGDPEKKAGNDALGMLSTALADGLDVDRKKRVLSERYGISMTESVERTVANMCNLSTGIEERAKARGIKQGNEQGIEQKTIESIGNMIDRGYPDDEISLCLAVPIEKVAAARSGKSA